MRPAGDFWAITCFFNPAGSRRRLTNYLVFRQRLTVPLITVELVYPGQVALPDAAADILIRRHSGAVLWQKERLLNLALEALPKHCAKFAWLDSDVVFQDETWPARTQAILDDHPLVQPFRDVYDLGPAAAVDFADRPSGMSLAYALSIGAVGAHALPGNMRRVGVYSGLAWAARRELFAADGFYDTCILGSGNRAMVYAALGYPEDAVAYLCMGERWAAHYRAWATPHGAKLRDRISFVEGGLAHLWHGDLARRQYAARHIGLSRFAFDPTTDIALDAQGCWQWTAAKPALHQYVRDYFASRHDDGSAAGAH